jgi:hypothetical protein
MLHSKMRRYIAMTQSQSGVAHKIANKHLQKVLLLLQLKAVQAVRCLAELLCVVSLECDTNLASCTGVAVSMLLLLHSLLCYINQHLCTLRASTAALPPLQQQLAFQMGVLAY